MSNCEVWFGREWRSASIVERLPGNSVRAVIPEVSPREMTFRPSEFRELPAGDRR